MIVSQGWQPVFCSELGAPFELAVVNRSRNNKHWRVSLREIELVLSIQTELLAPLQVNSLPRHFIPNVSVERPTIDIVDPIGVIHVNFVYVGKSVIFHQIWWNRSPGVKKCRSLQQLMCFYALLILHRTELEQKLSIVLGVHLYGVRALLLIIIVIVLVLSFVLNR